MFQQFPREAACPRGTECLSCCLLVGQLLLGEQVVNRWLTGGELMVNR